VGHPPKSAPAVIIFVGVGKPDPLSILQNIIDPMIILDYIVFVTRRSASTGIDTVTHKKENPSGAAIWRAME
jgi:hypothetical protein